MTTMELYQGRPESKEGRLPREIHTYDFLDRLYFAFWASLCRFLQFGQ